MSITHRRFCERIRHETNIKNIKAGEKIREIFGKKTVIHSMP